MIIITSISYIALFAVILTLLFSTIQSNGDLLMVATGTSLTSQDNITEIMLYYQNNIYNADNCIEQGEISPRSYSVGGLVQDLPLICGGLSFEGRG